MLIMAVSANISALLRGGAVPSLTVGVLYGKSDMGALIADVHLQRGFRLRQHARVGGGDGRHEALGECAEPDHQEQQRQYGSPLASLEIVHVMRDFVARFAHERA